MILGAVAGPEFTGPRGREAAWIFLVALAAFAVLPPAAAALLWTRRKDGDRTAAWDWVAGSVLLWNLLGIGLLGASTGSLFSYVLDQRGGWVVGQMTGLRPPPPAAAVSADAVAKSGPAPAAPKTSDAESGAPMPEIPPTPTEPRELLRCALRARLAATTFGGCDFLDAGSECLDRRTAAALGSGAVQSLRLGPAALAIGQGLKSLLGGGVSSAQKEKRRAEGESLDAEIERALAPWGVNLSDLAFGRKMERLIPGGRRFLREMSALKRRKEAETELGLAQRKKLAEKGLPPDGIDPELVAFYADEYADQAEFAPAKDGRRMITFRGKPFGEDRWELHFEDGAWRAAYVGGVGPER